MVSGADTIALADGNLPSFASIAVFAGATLKVSASDLALPPIALKNNSKLLVAEGVTLNLTNSLSCAATESLLPVVEFATNTVVNVPDGMKFMNMDLRLRGGLLARGGGRGGGGRRRLRAARRRPLPRVSHSPLRAPKATT